MKTSYSKLSGASSGMRLLITGGQGQLGAALEQALHEHHVTAWDYDKLDVTQREAVFDAVSQIQPDLIIHCAAYTDVDGCARDPQRAYAINGLGTQNVALACRAFETAMLHVSSNEVFAGDNPAGYEEWMARRPINAYGRSKAAAEKFVESSLRRYYIVRTAWLYAPGGRNFIHAILQRAQKAGELRVVADEVGNPTYVHDLAQAISQLIATEQYGAYHFVNEGATSRWAFANEILRLAGLTEIANRPILTREFQRASSPPLYGALRNVAGAAIGIRLRPWQEALADYWQEHGR